MNQGEMRLATEEAFRAYLLATETNLALPDGYIWSMLRDGSDWEFIGKLSVVVEAATTEAIISKVDDDRLRGHFSGASQSTRLKLCKVLDILTEEECSLLRRISVIRNAYMHQLSNLNSTLDTFVEGMPKGERASMVGEFAVPGYVPPSTVSWRERIFYGAIFPLMTLGLQTTLHGKQNESKHRAIESFKAANPLQMVTFPSKTAG